MLTIKTGCGLPCSKHQRNPYQAIHEADLHSLSHRLESLLQNIFSKNSLKPGEGLLLILDIPNQCQIYCNNHSS